MGTPQFAVPSLELLIKKGYRLSCVVTAPDKPKGRGQKMQSSEVKLAAERLGLKILQPEMLRQEDFIGSLKSLNADLFIVTAFRILPREVYMIPRLGAFNLHASLLPKYRGAAPINWALINGENETGVTSFFLQDKVDTGNIILQEKIAIHENDSYGTVYEQLSHVGAELTLRTVELIADGNVKILPQDDSKASPAPKIFKSDCLINWDQPAAKIHNFIRGLSPLPSAFTYLEGRVLKIFDSEVSSLPSHHPGTLFVKDKVLYVSASDLCLKLNSLQNEGKKRVSAFDFVNSLDKSKIYQLS